MSASPDLMETAQCLCLASRRAARAITQAFDRALRPHGLRATQFTLLATLELKGSRSIGELADFIGADRTTLTRNVALAEQKWLVEVRRDERDARSRRVEITPAGRKALHAAFATWRRVQADLGQRLGEDAASGLRRLGGAPGLRTRRSPPKAPSEEPQP